MTTQTKTDFKIPDELMDIYQEMEISPVGLLKNCALNVVCGKIHKYEIENICFLRHVSGQSEAVLAWLVDEVRKSRQTFYCFTIKPIVF